MSKMASGRSPAMLTREMTPMRGKPIKLDSQTMELLKGVPLFAGLSRRHLRTLAGLSHVVRFGAGRTVVQYGSRGTAFFVIVHGKVKVTAGYSNRAFARLGPGGFFGELALLDGGPRTASVVADTPLVTIRITRFGFRKMLESNPDVALKLMEELSGRLRRDRSPSD